MGVKHGVSRQRKNIDRGCSRTGCWGEYCNRRGM